MVKNAFDRDQSTFIGYKGLEPLYKRREHNYTSLKSLEEKEMLEKEKKRRRDGTFRFCEVKDVIKDHESRYLQ